MITLLLTDVYWFITVILMSNCSFDINDFLTILYCEEFEEWALKEKNSFFNVMKIYWQVSECRDNRYHILNLYYWHNLFINFNMMNKITLVTLLWILNRIMLRKIMRTEMKTEILLLQSNRSESVKIVVSINISSYVIQIIECFMNTVQLAQYTEIHQTLVHEFCDKVSETLLSTEEQQKLNKRFNISMYQRLCYASFLIELKYLWRVISFKHEENLTIDIVKWWHKSEDKLTWLISCMYQNVTTSYVSENQEWIVFYLTNITLKFLTLMIIIKKICVDKKNHLLIFITFLMF